LKAALPWAGLLAGLLLDTIALALRLAVLRPWIMECTEVPFF
jgi:hypothetical protein